MEKSKIVEGKKMTFKQLLFLLNSELNDGILKNFIFQDCYVDQIPKEVIIWHKFKYRGRWIDTFCGFLCDHVIIQRNIFKGKSAKFNFTAK